MRHDGARGVGVRRYPLIEQHESRNEHTRTLLCHNTDVSTTPQPVADLVTPPWQRGADHDEPGDMRGSRLKLRRAVQGQGSASAQRHISDWASGPSPATNTGDGGGSGGFGGVGGGGGGEGAHTEQRPAGKASGMMCADRARMQRSGGGGMRSASYTALNELRQTLSGGGKVSKTRETGARRPGGVPDWFKPAEGAWTSPAVSPGHTPGEVNDNLSQGPQPQSVVAGLEFSIRRARSSQRQLNAEVRQLQALSVGLQREGSSRSGEAMAALQKAASLRGVANELQTAVQAMESSRGEAERNRDETASARIVLLQQQKQQPSPSAHQRRSQVEKKQSAHRLRQLKQDVQDLDKLLVNCN